MKNQLLKFVLKNLLSWAIIMVWMTLTWLLLVYAAVVFPWKVNNWEVLDASTINNIIDNLFWKSDNSWNISYSWWNVWIWTNAPSEKLDLWWGNIKMGYEIVKVTCSNNSNCIAYCSSGKYIIWWSCLSFDGSALLYNWMPWWDANYAWSCSTANNWSKMVSAICANIR